MNKPDELLDRVRAALAHVPGVAEKRMFGSIGFMVRGNLCVSCRPERIMCRIDPAGHDQAIARDGCRTVVMRGRECRGYIYVDAEAVQTQAALRRWIALALAFNESLQPK